MKKTNLTNLVINYKITKKENILEEIFKLLKIKIKEKVDYTFYQRRFPLNQYYKCKSCSKCKFNKPKKNPIKEELRKQLCENCLKCTCLKGTFNLNENHLCQYKDVEQDLYILILEIIKVYNGTKTFEIYFKNYLWDYIPTFINRDFINSLNNESLYQINEEGEETELEIEDKKTKISHINLIFEDILKECKTENERKICELYFQNSNISEEEIGKILKMTKQNISLILKQLRERLKKYLTK